jgi:hypothetical protein
VWRTSLPGGGGRTSAPFTGHARGTAGCDGKIYFGLAWCSTCCAYAGAMVFVPRREHLLDLLADLPASERERLMRSDVKLLDYLDRLVRRGKWSNHQL